MISVKNLFELIIIVLTIKLMVSRYQPPIQESFQAMICIALGTVIAISINPTRDGIITGLVGSGFAFYGGELFAEFKSVKNDIDKEIDNGNLSFKEDLDEQD